MNFRRITGLVGSVTAAWVALGTETAQAQLEDLGDNIANAVSGSVSGVATNSTTTSDGTVTGATSVEHTESSLGEEEGVAIADASGGSNNLSFVS